MGLGGGRGMGLGGGGGVFSGFLLLWGTIRDQRVIFGTGTPAAQGQIDFRPLTRSAFAPDNNHTRTINHYHQHKISSPLPPPPPPSHSFFLTFFHLSSYHRCEALTLPAPARPPAM